MSKVSITGNASGTGTLTIAAPNTNTARTLTLPDNTGTILTNATAGTVLQVVEGSTTTSTASTSTTLADTTLTASITPTRASSKIIVMVSQATNINRATSNTGAVYFRLLRGATSLYDGIPDWYAETGGGFSQLAGRWTFNYVDAPNSTSSLTYKTQFRVSTTLNSCTATVQSNSIGSTIILMEIAA